MICKNCGTENVDGSIYCMGCGANLQDQEKMNNYADNNKAENTDNSVGGNYSYNGNNTSGNNYSYNENNASGSYSYNYNGNNVGGNYNYNGNNAGGNYNNNGNNYNGNNMNGNYPQNNNGDFDYTPISMWGYVGYELLFSIPIAGFILLIVFSVGGTKNINLRNFARSYLCILAITFAIIFVLFILAFTLIGSAAYSYYY